ncbi:MAG: choice-of-anchor B family protein [Chloroflexota bacterium]
MMRKLALLSLIIVALTMAWAARPGHQAQAAVAAPNTAAPCISGMADIYPCLNVDFLAFLSLAELGAGKGVTGANLWGWTDPDTGKEYVLMGLNDATAFVDISDPVNPVYLGSLPTHTIPAATYRDVKVYQDYAFIIADVPSEHGLQVFDLTQLPDVTNPPVTFSESAYFGGFGNGHNIFIDEETGYAYVARTSQCGGALYMIDVNDPLNPTFAGCYDDDGLASDSHCVIYHGPDADYQGREICLVSSDDAFVLGDVTDKNAPVHLARLTYTDAERAHHAWFTEDQQYFVGADMNDEHHHGFNTRIFMWDVSDLDAPLSLGYYEGPTPASDHNVWVKGDYAYVGNFRAGLRILSLTDIANGNLTEAGYLDIYPADDNTGHEGGAWATYVYFDSGVVAVSDKEAGLYLVQSVLEPTSVQVSDFGGEPVTQSVIWLALLLVVAAAMGLLAYRKLASS